MTSSLPVPQSSSVNTQNQSNPFFKLAIFFWLAELFIVYSRFFDVIANGLHVPTVVLFFLLLTSFVTGTLFRGLASKIGKLLMVMFFWVTLATIFSIWRGGALPVYELFASALLGFVFVSGLPSSLRNIRQTLYTLALSSVVAAILSFYFGGYVNGRLEIAQGAYADPNEFAMCLLMGVPFCLLMSSSTKSIFLKGAYLLTLVPVFWSFFNTGSRGGLIGLIVFLVLLLWEASFAKKIVILIATAGGLVWVVSFMPSYLKARYSTYFSIEPSAPAAGSEYLQSDVGSAEARKDLIKKSIMITMAHPFLGVGPGDFPAALDWNAKQQGSRTNWMVTHNSYTQASSETGIPGLIMLVMVIIYSFREINGIYKVTGPNGSFPRPDFFECAKYLRLSIASLAVCMFFLSVAFDFNLYLLAGVIVSLRRILNNEMAVAAASVPMGGMLPPIEPARHLGALRPSGRPVAGFPSVQVAGSPLGKYRGSN